MFVDLFNLIFHFCEFDLFVRPRRLSYLINLVTVTWTFTGFCFTFGLRVERFRLVLILRWNTNVLLLRIGSRLFRNYLECRGVPTPETYTGRPCVIIRVHLTYRESRNAKKRRHERAMRADLDIIYIVNVVEFHTLVRSRL